MKENSLKRLHIKSVPRINSTLKVNTPKDNTNNCLNKGENYNY